MYDHDQDNQLNTEELIHLLTDLANTAAVKGTNHANLSPQSQLDHSISSTAEEIASAVKTTCTSVLNGERHLHFDRFLYLVQVHWVALSNYVLLQLNCPSS